MVSRIFPIAHAEAGRLAIVGRPAAGSVEQDVTEWRRRAGLDVVASLLEPDEAAELGLANEEDLCRAAGIDFIGFPIPDRAMPASAEDLIGLAERLAGVLSRGGAAGIHCRAGIGRSGIVAASVLIALGSDCDAAFAAVSAARGVTVPDTPEQRAWVASLRFGERMPARRSPG